MFNFLNKTKLQSAEIMTDGACSAFTPDTLQCYTLRFDAC